MTIKYINNWSSELLEPMSAANKTLPVSADKLLLLEDVTPDGEYRITLTDGTNYEVISVSRDNYAAPLSVSRGVDNTAPRSWPATTKVFAGLTAGMLSELRNLSQSVRNVSGAMTVIDVNEAGKWVCLLEGDTSISLSTAHTGAQASVLLMQDEAGGHAVSWPDLIDWAGSNEHGRIGGQVTKIDLVKIGLDRWGASSTVYPVPPVPVRALYAFAWQGQDDKVLLSIADDSQSVLFSVGMPTDMTEDINSLWDYAVWLSVSPDSRFVLFRDSVDTPARLYNSSNWSFIEIDAPYSKKHPAKIPPQIRGDWVYGCNDDAYSLDPGVYRISVVTGVRENTGILLDGHPQSLSCSDGEITLTFNMTTSDVADMSSPILTYDINTFTLAADQFSYPDGAATAAWPPSPYGIAGRYSVDGSMYALSANLRYDSEPSERANLFIYDATTKQIIQTHTFSVEHNADQYIPTWSANGKYCAVVSTKNVILVADVESNTSIEIDLSPYGNQPERSEIMLTNDGFIIATINDTTSPKPFITLSAVTGLQAPDWGGSVYGSDAGQLGLIIGSNQ